MPEKDMLDQESEVVRRCCRVRQELFARFKTPDELHSWLVSREKQGGHRLWVRIAKAQAVKRIKPAARNGKPANGKPVHRA